jgi:hypothetical protein
VKFHKGKPITETATGIDEDGISVTITSSWPEGKPAFIGTMITLTAHVSGDNGREYTLQWQRSEDGSTWTDLVGEEGQTFTYELNEDTARYSWRVVATIKK